jgi:hypothetical protein
MKDDFVNCPHCGTLNFGASHKCSLCKFMLPVVADHAVGHPRLWKSLAISLLLIFLGALLVFALTLNRGQQGVAIPSAKAPSAAAAASSLW